MKKLFYIFTSLIFAYSVPAYAQENITFVFAKVNESIMPIVRHKKYEDPLDSALRLAKLGEVTGGGSSLSETRQIEWVGIDIELTNVEKGIPFLKSKLRQLGAPKGSTLEYKYLGKTVVVSLDK